MEKPIANLETGTVTFPKAGKKSAEPEAVVYPSIPKSLMDRLLQLAYADGYEPDAETDKGVQQQNTKAARAYLLMGAERLLADREASEPEEG